MTTKDLRKQEAKLKAQLDRERQAYTEAAATGPEGLADLRAQIAATEGALADVRASIEAAEAADRERQRERATAQRRVNLEQAIAFVIQRESLAKELQSQIATLGQTYQQFVEAGDRARQLVRAGVARSRYEDFDHALGVQQGINQNLVGLMQLAGLGPVIIESGPLMGSVMRGGPSFTQIQTKRSQRAIGVATDELKKEAA